MRVSLILGALAVPAHAQVQTDWWRTYDGLSGQMDRARASVVDAAGNSFVVGIASAPSTLGNFLVMKYSPTGVQLWAVERDVAGMNVIAEACALASTGDLYVFGQTWGGTSGSALALMKFSSSGAWLWTRTLSSALLNPAWAGNVVVDAGDNAIVCGGIQNAGTGYDAIFQSYSPSGALNWSRIVDGGVSGTDRASRVQWLPSGEIIGIGALMLAANDSDFAAWKLDASGNVLWTSTRDGGAQLNDAASKLAVSPSGKLLASGITSTASAGNDWMVAQFDVATGASDWTDTYDAAGFAWDQVSDVAVDDHGVWWVTGAIDTGVSWRRSLTRRYDASGSVLSSHRWPSVPPSTTGWWFPSSLRIGEAGQVWVAGVGAVLAPSPSYSGIKPFVLRYDTDGNFLGSHDAGASGASYDDEAHLSVAPSAKLVLVGATHVGTGSAIDAFVSQIDLTHVPHGYCTAKTTSNGCEPRVEFVGAPSVAATSGFVVRARELRNLRNGLLFYGVSSQAAPFHGGTLCVAPPLGRTPSQNSGGSALPVNDCSGTFSLDINAFAHSSSAALALRTVGTDIYCQFWGRDPGFAAPNGVMLTNALAHTVRP